MTKILYFFVTFALVKQKANNMFRQIVTFLHRLSNAHRCCTLVLTVLLCNSLRADIPVIAFYGVPPAYSTVERFQEFKDAGFDISLFNYESLPVDSLVSILDKADKAHVRILMFSHQLLAKPQQVIPRIRKHPALYGYMLGDEPKPADFKNLQHMLRTVRQWDKVKPCYVNLLPDYGEGSRKELGISSYKNYLKQASTALDLPIISFDHYPIIGTAIRDTWYSNLEDIRRESLRTGKPFWAFVLCTPHADYPQPDMSMLRLQIYSNLAYGAQAIQYFTYWTPASYDIYDFHNAPISFDGKRTKTYNLVKQMNQELHRILPLFDGAVNFSVSHLLDIPQGTAKASQRPKNIRKLKIKGAKGCIVSTFTNNGHLYLAIVNKDYRNKLALEIKASKQVVMLDKKLQEHAVAPSYHIAGGDMMTFRLQ